MIQDEKPPEHYSAKTNMYDPPTFSLIMTFHYDLPCFVRYTGRTDRWNILPVAVCMLAKQNC